MFSFDDDDDDDGRLTRNIIDKRWFVITAIVLFFIAAVLSPLFYLCFFIRRRERRRAMIRREMSMPAIQRMGIPAAQTPRTGLQEPAIAALPTCVYKKGNGGGGGGDDCSVCLAGLEEGETAKMLPNCNHMFHARCIDTWLYWHSTCPVCRARAELPAGAGDPQADSCRAMSSTTAPDQDPPGRDDAVEV
ncbi:hypothetical protein ACLOJK_010449 [Asimina triloba]